VVSIPIVYQEDMIRRQERGLYIKRVLAAKGVEEDRIELGGSTAFPGFSTQRGAFAEKQPYQVRGDELVVVLN